MGETCDLIGWNILILLTEYKNFVRLGFFTGKAFKTKQNKNNNNNNE